MFLLIIISVIVVQLWYGFNPNMLLTSHDTGAALDPIGLVKTRLYAWHSGINLGVSQIHLSGGIIYYGIEALATYFTNSVFWGQRIVVTLWFFLPMFVLYIVLRKITVFANKPFMALIASLLFQFNHYQQHGWRVLWRTRFATYMLLPVIWLLMMDYFEGRRTLLKTSIYVALSVFLLNGGGSPPVFGAVILLVLVTTSYYLLINLHHNITSYIRRSVLFILFSGIFSFILSSHWIVPFLYFTFATYSQTVAAYGGLLSIIAWTDVVSLDTSILNLLRNVGIPFWDTSRGDPLLFRTIPLLIILSFLWPILALSSMFFVKVKVERKLIILFLILMAVGLVFTAGTHKPFRDFYIFLYTRIPGYVMFRSPLYKFGNLLWFAYSILIAFTISSIISRVKIARVPKIVIPVIFITTIFLWDYSVFNNKFFSWHPPLTTMENIPPYVFSYKNWVDKNSDYNSRTLLLPGMQKEWSWEVYRWGYASFGSQLFPLLTDKNTLTNDTASYEGPSTREAIDTLYEMIKNGVPSWVEVANDLNIRYLLLRKDYYYNSDLARTVRPDIYEKILSQENKVEKIQNFGQWDLYQIKLSKSNEKIFLETTPTVYFDLDSNVEISKHLTLVHERGVDLQNKPILISNEAIKDNIESDRNLLIIPHPEDMFIPPQQFTLPTTNFIPGHPLYFLTEKREKQLFERESLNHEDTLNIYLDLSVLRLTEINRVIEENGDIEIIERVLDKYALHLGDIRKIVEELIKNEKSFNLILAKTKWYLIQEKKIIENFINNPKMTSLKISSAVHLGNINDLIEIIPLSQDQESILYSKKLTDFESDAIFLDDEYKLGIPENGLYEIYIKNNSLLRNFGKLYIQIGNQSSEKVLDIHKSVFSWQKVEDVVLDKGSWRLNIKGDETQLSSIRRYDVALYKQANKTITAQSEIISYRRINPTRFWAKITSVNPVILMFDEKFETGWKLYLKEKFEMQGVLNEQIFNTIGLRPITEDKHMKVNGYANGWLINPKTDLVGEETEVIIEYEPQRVFYAGFLINGVALAGATVYLIFTKRSIILNLFSQLKAHFD